MNNNVVLENDHVDSESVKGKDGSFNQMLGFVAVFLLGVVLSSSFLYFVVLRKLPKSSEACPQLSGFNPIVKGQVQEDNLPVSLPLLTNPIVYEWRGSVEGRITRKDEHTFTLEDTKRNQITITDVMASGDIFKTIFRNISKDNKAVEISLKEIPLGVTLRGDFWIFKNGKDIPVGGMFTVKK